MANEILFAIIRFIVANIEIVWLIKRVLKPYPGMLRLQLSDCWGRVHGWLAGWQSVDFQTLSSLRLTWMRETAHQPQGIHPLDCWMLSPWWDNRKLDHQNGDQCRKLALKHDCPSTNIIWQCENIWGEGGRLHIVCCNSCHKIKGVMRSLWEIATAGNNFPVTLIISGNVKCIYWLEL